MTFKPYRSEFYLNACRRSVEHKRRSAETQSGEPFTSITNDEIYAIECKVAQSMGLWAEPTREQAPEYSARMTAAIQAVTGI